MYCSTIQPFICACFFWKTEEKQALTWQRIAAHMEGEAVNRSVNTGQPVALGAGHPAGSQHCFAQAAWSPWRQGSCCLQLEPCLHGSSWKLALVLLAPRQAQCRCKLFTLSAELLQHWPTKDIRDKNKFPVPGYPLRVAAGLNTTPGPHSSPRVPAACCGSGINHLNPTTCTQSPCREDLARANVPAMFGGNFPKCRQTLKEVLHHPDSKWRGLNQKPMQVLMPACDSGNRSAWGTLVGMQPDVLQHLFYFA